jgi:2-amino-4-hydroxy-6-hydroxymethyldihydropteridine diphosphokinase
VNRVTIGLGANLGEPSTQLQQAVEKLQARAEIAAMAVSPMYESPPLGPQDQPNFVNACLLATTTVAPEELLIILQAIEQAMGKAKVRHWGERCIDLDLLTYGNVHLNTATLQLPHPGVYQRRFVLQPLRDLLGGNFKMPNGEEIDTLLEACPPMPLVSLAQRLTLAK